MNPLLETANKSSREKKLWNKQAKDENSQGVSLLHGHGFPSQQPLLTCFSLELVIPINALSVLMVVKS